MPHHRYWSVTSWGSMEKRKCYNCRKPVKGTAIVCKNCVDKDLKTTSTYIIFDKI